MVKFSALLPGLLHHSCSGNLPKHLTLLQTQARNASLYYGGFPKAKFKASYGASTSLYPKLSTRELNRQKKQPKVVPVRPRTSAASLPLRRKLIGVAPQYAKTLYIAASEARQLKKIHSDLLKIQSRLTTDTSLRSSIKALGKNSSFTQHDVEDLSADLYLSWTTIDFLKELVRQGKISLLDQIISSFSVIMANNRKDLVCEVTTATPLEKTTLNCVRDKVRASLKTGRDIKVVNVVDRSLGHGVALKLGDCMLDMSIAKKLQKYEMILKKAAYMI